MTPRSIDTAPLQRRDITLREPLTGNASVHSFLEMSITDKLLYNRREKFKTQL
jgi:hypothetical protein